MPFTFSNHPLLLTPLIREEIETLSQARSLYFMEVRMPELLARDNLNQYDKEALDAMNKSLYGPARHALDRFHLECYRILDNKEKVRELEDWLKRKGALD